MSDPSEITGMRIQGTAFPLIKCARNEDMPKRYLGPLLGCQTTETMDAKAQEFLQGSPAGRRPRSWDSQKRNLSPRISKQRTSQRDAAVERRSATPWPGPLGLVLELYPQLRTPKMNSGKLPDHLVALPYVDTWNKLQGEKFWFSWLFHWTVCIAATPPNNRHTTQHLKGDFIW